MHTWILMLFLSFVPVNIQGSYQWDILEMDFVFSHIGSCYDHTCSGNGHTYHWDNHCISRMSLTLCVTTIHHRLKIAESCHWHITSISWSPRTFCGITVKHRLRVVASCHRDTTITSWSSRTLRGTTTNHRIQILNSYHWDTILMIVHQEILEFVFNAYICLL